MGQSNGDRDMDTDTTVDLDDSADTGSDIDTTGDTDSETTTDESGGLSRMFVVGGAIAAIGIVMSGLMVYLLDRIGPPGSGELMWIFGYGLTIFALWYLLLRPIDFSSRY
ncbi:hypothetical protein [Halocatena marina]|nr:hypothetical protein [Halocatena marina]